MPVAPSAFDSFEPSARRMSGWWAKIGGRVEQVASADHEIDALALVVDHHAEGIRPLPIPVAEDRIAAGRDIADAWSREPIRPRLPTLAERHSHRRLGDGRARPAAARTAGARPRSCVHVGPGAERRARAVAGIGEAVRPEPVECRVVWGVVLALADRAEVGSEPEPLEVFEQRGVVLGPAARAVMILDPKQHQAVVAGREGPHHHRVRDVPQVQVAGRRGREPGQGHGRAAPG
jgi:hypothetical protein